jgi:hypothetical protein
MKATIALLLTASLALGATHVFGQAAFPPPPPKVSPAAGVVDLHVHSHPDVFGRNMDDIDIANLAKARGMRGIVLKNHIGETASRAALVMKVVPGIVVSSDLGQSANITHPDGLEVAINAMKREGIGDADIDAMVRKNPARLLGLAN